MHYLGSKTKLIPFIKACLKEVLGRDLKTSTFCDLFAGSGAVSDAFREEVGTLIANDQEYFSYILLRNILRLEPLCEWDRVVAQVQASEKRDGFLVQEYANTRSYFSLENARKIEGVRQSIEAYKEQETLYISLLASLLESVHAISNTTSVYSAFLKHLKPMAQQTFCFTPMLYSQMSIPCHVYCEDANTLIRSIKGDILYLDPPYNHRQYSANYHLLNTIARYDRFVPKGKTGLRAYVSSRYCKAGTAMDALEDLIANAQFKTIVLSYNNEGLLENARIASMLKLYGEYRCFTQVHERFKAHGHQGKNPKTEEFLHVLSVF